MIDANEKLFPNADETAKNPRHAAECVVHFEEGGSLYNAQTYQLEALAEAIEMELEMRRNEAFAKRIHNAFPARRSAP